MDTGITVPIVYTCRVCGINEREIRVRERTADENVIAWMNAVQMAVAKDHLRMSPTCTSKSCDLKIPLANPNAAIGQAVRQ